MLNRYNPPDFQILQHVHVPRVQSHTLTNGIKLHWLNAGEQPIVRIELIFKAGNWYESQRNVSYFTIKMMNEGTTRMTARQINEYIDQFGAFLEFNHGQDKSSITLYTITKHLEKLLPVLKDIVTGSTFPEKELQNIKNISIQNLKVNQEKTAYLAQTRFRELLFGKDHPYGKNMYEEDILRIEPEALKQFYLERITSQPFDIVAAGEVSEQTLALLRHTFEDIVVRGISLNGKEYSQAPISIKEDIVEKSESLQSTLRMGRKLFTRSHPDYIKMLVLNEILGGYFGSRLMRNIREEKGFTYGISSNLVTLQQLGYFVIGTDVKREFTSLTIEEVYKEMQILRTELVEEEELEVVKNYMAGSFAGSLSTPFTLADHFKAIYFDGLTYDFYDNYIENILNTSARQLQELANQYLTDESMLVVIAGGK
ncbi:insulinase family protein [Rhodocytophaga rosea]|uniref:Insulinase family protein n=1 Tax=Rhodocytophaga rosea TaxID=2704465 RepID=A0A6C0GNF8_9BACT|nr:pitrilysin family protein [Rhodocytophaga rosea]QHT69565.1 insulinase family protein [Rhodocytophaga rosea]